MAKVANLSNMLICELINNGKLPHMRYLNITMARLTGQENVEDIFSHQPKHHQAKYALGKEEVDNDIERL
eukprot:1247334-Ditylum_brightwellii.AAC.2